MLLAALDSPAARRVRHFASALAGDVAGRFVVVARRRRPRRHRRARSIGPGDQGRRTAGRRDAGRCRRRAGRIRPDGKPSGKPGGKSEVGGKANNEQVVRIESSSAKTDRNRQSVNDKSQRENRPTRAVEQRETEQTENAQGRPAGERAIAPTSAKRAAASVAEDSAAHVRAVWPDC